MGRGASFDANHDQNVRRAFIRMVRAPGVTVTATTGSSKNPGLHRSVQRVEAMNEKSINIRPMRHNALRGAKPALLHICRLLVRYILACLSSPLRCSQMGAELSRIASLDNYT